jgi:NAD(P)-dependent dehydrogenase (short-subunit alcohol dehydrogenase family)
MTTEQGRSKWVVVTGASSGIGEATATELGRRGFQVLGTYRNESDGRRLEAAGIVPVSLDVTDQGSIDAAAATVSRRVGTAGLAGLVNNAGVAGGGPVELVAMSQVRHVLEVNLFGALAVTQAFFPLLKTARGRVVMMSSVSGRIAMPFLGPYAASKFGLEALSDCLRRERPLTGVDVVVVEPGPIATPIWDRVEEMDVNRYSGTPYDEILRRGVSDAVEEGRAALPASAVADAVAEALTRPRPPARIMVVQGWRKPLLRLLRVLPDRWLDRLTSRGMTGQEVQR